MRRTVSLVLAAVLALAACNAGSDSVDTAAGVRFVLDSLRARTQGASRLADWNKTLDEALPNVEYRRANGDVGTITDLVVVGTVVEVERGRGFTIPGCRVEDGNRVGECDAPGGTPDEFDDPNALWWNVHATVAVDHAIASSESPERVQVALGLGRRDDFELMAAGLQGLGRVVLFLRRGGPLVEYDQSLYVVHRDGAYIATVAEDGALALPAVEPHEQSALLATVPRLADLEAWGDAPRRTLAAPEHA